jgi:hypothetical protein
VALEKFGKTRAFCLPANADLSVALKRAANRHQRLSSREQASERTGAESQQGVIEPIFTEPERPVVRMPAMSRGRMVERSHVEECSLSKHKSPIHVTVT